jgi:hypothetical protein
MDEKHPIEEAVAKFLPQRHRPPNANSGQMPEPGTADRLAVLTLIEKLESHNDAHHRHIKEELERIRDQLKLAFGNIDQAGEQMINAIRSLRG